MARCPFAEWKPVTSHGGPMTAQLGAIEHVTTNHGDPYNFFANPANRASSHFWIADDGHLAQYIDTELASWAQAGGNYQYVSVETSGTPDQPLTAAQVATFARLYQWGHDTHGWLYQLAETPGVKGLGWHGMGGAAWGGHFDCPGDLRKAQRAQILTLAQSKEPTVPKHNPPLVLEPIVFDMACPTGGAWLLAASGAVYAFGGAPFGGSVNGQPYFVGRVADHLELPRTNEVGPYIVVATSGERYDP